MQFSEKVQNVQENGAWTLNRKLAVVGFFKQSGVSEFMTLKRESGQLSNADLDRRLQLSRAIRLDRIVTSYKDRKFIDHKPPVPYLLQIIWDYLLSRYASEMSRDESKRWFAIDVTVARITDDLQEYFGYKSMGARSPEIPRYSWVKEALEALVQFRLAERGAKNGSYQIRYNARLGILCKSLAVYTR